MMELGATVCLPRAPKCTVCPLAAECQAYRLETTLQLPVKLRKKEPVEIAATVAIITRGGRLLLWRRPAGAGRMAGFWELPEPSQLPELCQSKSLGRFRHTITHHHYLYEVTSGDISDIRGKYRWIPYSRLRHVPLSTIARKALRLCDEFAEFL